MTIAFPVDKAIGFTKFKPKIIHKSVKLTSPFTSKTQIQGFPYFLWNIDVTVGTVDASAEPLAAGKLRSFLAQLQGMAQSFSLIIPGTAFPLSGYTGAVGTVNGAGQSGMTISTKGWTPNSNVLAEGDMVNIGNELKVLTAGAASNSGGIATLLLDTPLRYAYADAAALTINNVFGIFNADTDDVAGWDLTSPILHDISFTATEMP